VQTSADVRIRASRREDIPRGHHRRRTESRPDKGERYHDWTGNRNRKDESDRTRAWEDRTAPSATTSDRHRERAGGIHTTGQTDPNEKDRPRPLSDRSVFSSTGYATAEDPYQPLPPPSRSPSPCAEYVAEREPEPKDHYQYPGPNLDLPYDNFNPATWRPTPDVYHYVGTGPGHGVPAQQEDIQPTEVEPPAPPTSRTLSQADRRAFGDIIKARARIQNLSGEWGSGRNQALTTSHHQQLNLMVAQDIGHPIQRTHGV
jgi:hypothetical protein